jgi:hypothetical protein
MSIEMQKALENDMGVINTNGSVDYVDTPTEDEPTVEATAAVVEEPVEVSVEEIPQEQVQADDFADLMNG